MNATIRTIALPEYGHPIWKLGHSHVELAWSICNAFLALKR